MQKKVCIAFLGNALHDSRIVNLTNSLIQDGFTVSVISFDWFISKNSFSDKVYKVHKLKKGKFSLFFYWHFVILLMKNLIKTKADYFIAEDFYTLPFVSFVGKLKKAKIYYNSRELYAFLGGLRKRPILQWIVKQIEKYFIKKVDYVLTTGEMDSEFIEKFYRINNTIVIRNIPFFQSPTNVVDFRKQFSICTDKIILLYQGVLLEGRGISLILQVMRFVPETVLVLLGDGEQKGNIIKLAEEYNIIQRIFFVGTIKQNDLINYTAGADIGLSLIENISISYYHALPNKLFEYIMAGLPVIASDLPQMKKIVEQYRIGEAINITNLENIIEVLKKWIANPDLLKSYKKNCIVASQELNWQKEYNRARSILFGIE
jgi:glycosyltransferase involved in cell wall biosynthesis